MCTVILDVPTRADAPIRLLAVRDEDPERAWDPPGEWWPEERPGVVGVRDRRANGAWLAAVGPSAGPGDGAARLAVILNRGETVRPRGAAPLASRGGIVLDAVAGIEPADPPGTAAFNLVEVSTAGARVTEWGGSDLRRARLSPGVHMLAHDGVDDRATARIAHWLPEFSALREQGSGSGSEPFPEWRERWISLLARSAELGPTDDRAIIRDNRPHGYPTLSLLVCVAEVGDAGIDLVSAVLRRPGRWGSPAFGAPLALR
ncbi:MULTISPECIES: NRDE family protein [unclassified Leucobacter]|uniref:NRDE family protein n=1 Tax=unclassified Leucobacter TaxID=2621730 RepID=UPI003019D7EE